MNTAAAKGNDMETQAQTGSDVKVRRKPKARPPRTSVLTMNAIRNARLACLSSGFMFGLTLRITGAGQRCPNKTETQSRVQCMRHVRPTIHFQSLRQDSERTHPVSWAATSACACPVRSLEMSTERSCAQENLSSEPIRWPQAELHAPCRRMAR